jgi:hypothetical protein
VQAEDFLLGNAGAEHYVHSAFGASKKRLIASYIITSINHQEDSDVTTYNYLGPSTFER